MAQAFRRSRGESGVRGASPSSGLRPPSPTRGEGDGAEVLVSPGQDDVWGPSPLMGEGGRSPDEGEARTASARALRRRSTEAEKRLWQLLRDRRLAAFKFRRQVPIGRYIADFACYEARLVVELDGSQHAASVRDRLRDAQLEARGFRVLRVWNNELSNNRDGVLEGIFAAAAEGIACGAKTPSSGLRPPSPTRGEGLTDAAGGADAFP